MADGDLTARVFPGVSAVPSAAWDALAGPGNPFVSHAFLSVLEDSGSVGPGTGWNPSPIVIEDDRGTLLAALPAYLKGHSQGEYVFDHAWADAWHRAGGRYYPKLQIAVPFTPATGPRLLLSDEVYAAPLLRAAENLCLQHELSSAHATFIEPAQRKLFEQVRLAAAERHPVPLGKPRLPQLRRFPRGPFLPQAQGPAKGTRQSAGRRGNQAPYRKRSAA